MNITLYAPNSALPDLDRSAAMSFREFARSALRELYPTAHVHVAPIMRDGCDETVIHSSVDCEGSDVDAFAALRSCDKLLAAFANTRPLPERHQCGACNSWQDADESALVRQATHLLYRYESELPAGGGNLRDRVEAMMKALKR